MKINQTVLKSPPLVFSTAVPGTRSTGAPPGFDFYFLFSFLSSLFSRSRFSHFRFALKLQS